MLATLVSNEEELEQIHHLNHKNLKQQLSPQEQQEEGFVSWLYPLALLKQMHSLAPSVIIKDADKVAGYALTTLPEAVRFHQDLQGFFNHLKEVHYKHKPILSQRFYCMGQICIDKDYRGKGLFPMLYQHHRKTFSNQYDFLLTEIATRNKRSQRAHEQVGFKTIFTYRDEADEWNVVVWDWT